MKIWVELESLLQNIPYGNQLFPSKPIMDPCVQMYIDTIKVIVNSSSNKRILEFQYISSKSIYSVL